MWRRIRYIIKLLSAPVPPPEPAPHPVFKWQNRHFQLAWIWDKSWWTRLQALKIEGEPFAYNDGAVDPNRHIYGSLYLYGTLRVFTVEVMLERTWLLEFKSEKLPDDPNPHFLALTELDKKGWLALMDELNSAG